MKCIYIPILGMALVAPAMQCLGQSARSSRAPVAVSARYFQVTMNLKFGAVGDQSPTTQTITTEVAIRDGRPGSCKARMTSQVPTGNGSGTKYIELGTKLDCNDVHVEGNGIALQFTLETSRIADMIKTRNSDGVEIDEPLITQRTVQLTVKLPLEQPKVVFDSSLHPTTPLEPVGSTAKSEVPGPPRQDSPILIEMLASELK